jgi:hypothetical protein
MDKQLCRTLLLFVFGLVAMEISNSARDSPVIITKIVLHSERIQLVNRSEHLHITLLLLELKQGSYFLVYVRSKPLASQHVEDILDMIRSSILALAAKRL